MITVTQCPIVNCKSILRICFDFYWGKRHRKCWHVWGNFSMKVCSRETWNLLHWVKSPAPLAISDIAHYFQKKSVRKVYRHIYLAIQLNEVNFSLFPLPEQNDSTNVKLFANHMCYSGKYLGWTHSQRSVEYCQLDNTPWRNVMPGSCLSKHNYHQ